MNTRFYSIIGALVSILALTSQTAFAAGSPLSLMPVYNTSNSAIMNQNNEYSYLLRNMQHKSISFKIESGSKRLQINPILSTCKNRLAPFGFCKLVVDFKAPQNPRQFKTILKISTSAKQTISLPLTFNVSNKAVNNSNTVSTSKLQWQALPGPAGGFVMDTIISPNNPEHFYAAVYGAGVYRSINAGKNWEATAPIKGNYGNLHKNVSQVLIYQNPLSPLNQKSLFAVTNNGVYQSVDQGSHWRQVLDTSASTNYGYLQPTKNALYYVGQRALLVSKNGGQDWKQLIGNNNQFISGTTFLAQGKQDQTLLLGGQSSGLLKSNDGGKTWETLNNFPISGITINALLKVNGVIYAAGSNFNTNQFGIFTSDNDGQSWSAVRANGLPNGFFKLVAQGNTLYGVPFASGNSARSFGIFKSTDGGKNWTSISKGLPNLIVYNVTTTNSAIYASTASGIYKSSDAGETWQPLNTGIQQNPIVSLLSLKNGLVFAMTHSGNIFKSADNGLSWSAAGVPVNNVSSGLSLQADQIGNLYAIVNNKIYSSTDNGTNWNRLARPRHQSVNMAVNPKMLLVANSTLYLVSSNSGVYETMNNGQSWQHIRAGLGMGSVSSLAFINATKTLYAYASSYGLSSYVANNWQKNTTAPTFYNILQLATVPSMPSVLLASANSGIYMTSNSGNNWTALNNGLPTSPKITNLLTDGAAWIASSNSYAGAYLSTDQGKTWVAANNGLNQNAIISALAENSNFIFAGTANSGFYRTNNVS